MKLMAIINLTPDSFSDGGKHSNPAKALKHAQQLEAEGAHILDLGGESSGPGSPEVKLQEELDRVIPVLRKIRASTKLPISIDTYKAEVARQALEEGADMINDITALRGDAQMAPTIAKYKAPAILMYSKDPTARTTIQEKHYDDVIATIKTFLEERITYAQQNGIKEIIIDPGMGQFISAIPEYSHEIIARLAELKDLNCEILIGISRKSFLGGDMSQRDQKALEPTRLAIQNGASIIRTHNVKLTRELCQTCNFL